MFRVKICGITSREDARAVVEARADAVGLNFYPKSPRCVTLEKAQRIADVLPKEVVKVGLFVNATAEEVCRLSNSTAMSRRHCWPSWTTGR